MPRPPITIGIDGGYVRKWDDKKTHFEVIVGKSIPEEGTSKYFGLVQSYGDKPKRRLFEVLKGQGMQLNQQIAFFSDGGDTVRNLQLYLNPMYGLLQPNGSRLPKLLIDCEGSYIGSVTHIFPF